MKCKLVAYHRVSTKKPGDSGLGLEAQEAAVARHAAAYGCDVIGSYTEVESGKKNDRVELARAIAHAKRAKATLVIAKLDRLARNVAFVVNLMEAVDGGEKRRKSGGRTTADGSHSRGRRRSRGAHDVRTHQSRPRGG